MVEESASGTNAPTSRGSLRHDWNRMRKIRRVSSRVSSPGIRRAYLGRFPNLLELEFFRSQWEPWPFKPIRTAPPFAAGNL